jgi:hypothetical protein
MQRLEVRGAVRPLKWPLGVKWLKTYLRHVAVQVYHHQEAQYARFKTNCQSYAVIYKVLQSSVAPLLVSIGYKIYHLYRFLKTDG